METAPTCPDAPSSSGAGGISADTIDLLVCAAVAYGVLSDAASEVSPTSVGVKTREELARLWSEPVTGVAAPDPCRVGGRPVVGVDPVQVVKSAHAYEAACRQDSGWMGSEAQLWLRRVEVAAVQQVPGYAAASWQWVRPVQPVLVLGVATPGQELPLPGVRWVVPEAVAALWSRAHLVLVTAGAARVLRQGPVLPARRGVYLLGEALDEEAAVLSGFVSATVFVSWPTGRAWLTDVLRDPTRAPLGGDVPAPTPPVRPPAPAASNSPRSASTRVQAARPCRTAARG